MASYFGDDVANELLDTARMLVDQGYLPKDIIKGLGEVITYYAEHELGGEE